MNSAATVIDEYPIKQIPDTPLWSENYALVTVDGAKRASIFYSIGRWYADPTVWRENIAVATSGSTSGAMSHPYGAIFAPLRCGLRSPFTPPLHRQP